MQKPRLHIKRLENRVESGLRQRESSAWPPSLPPDSLQGPGAPEFMIPRFLECLAFPWQTHADARFLREW